MTDVHQHDAAMVPRVVHVRLTRERPAELVQRRAMRPCLRGLIDQNAACVMGFRGLRIDRERLLDRCVTLRAQLRIVRTVIEAHHAIEHREQRVSGAECGIDRRALLEHRDRAGHLGLVPPPDKIAAAQVEIRRREDRPRAPVWPPSRREMTPSDSMRG